MGRERQPTAGSVPPGSGSDTYVLDVDFALDIDESDEDLPAPTDLDHPWVRRTRVPAYGVLTLLALGLVLLHHRGGDGAPDTPAPTVTRAGEIVEITPARAPDRTSDGLVSDDLGLACPAGNACRTTTTVPAAVTAALDATFRGHAAISARTLTAEAPTGPQLIGRFVHTASAAADVTVQVITGRLPASASASGRGASSLVVLQRPAAGSVDLTVRVTVGGPAASTLRQAAPARLLADPRLLQLR